MSWNQLKAPVIAGVVLIATVVVFVLGIKAIRSSRESQYPSLQGAWQGTLLAGPSKLRLVLKVTKTNNTWQATMDSVDQMAQDIPVSSVEYKHSAVRLEVNAVKGTYEATMNPSGTELTGTWTQGQPLPLVLTRTAEPDTIPAPMAESDYAPRQGSDIQGYWRGTIQPKKDLTLRIALKIAELPDGKIRVEGESIDQGAQRIPASSVTYRPPKLTVEFGGMGVVCSGTVNPRDKTISGTLTQGGETLPVVLSLADPRTNNAEEAKRDYSHTGPDDLPGHWLGTLDIKKANIKLRLKLNIGRMPDGKLGGSMISLDQGNADIPATLVEFSPPTVHMEWKPIGAAFYGKLENGKITGAWRQGGGALPLELERTGSN